MKKEYSSIDEFKKDLNKEYSFKDICIINSWINENEFVGQMVKCKFHEEKTPSMQIGDHFFRCYGCGAKGDIFSFAQKFNNYSFMEALNDISLSIGVKISLKNGYKYEEIKHKKIALAKEWEEYKRQYLIYCKKDKNVLNEGMRYFPFDVGYDVRENRIVLAFIKNNEPLGFTKRRIIETDTPKWKHSNMEKTLTNLVSNIFNIDSLKDSDTAFIVEGPGDVASMVRSGFSNCICCCGTSNISNSTIDRIVSEGIKSFILIPDGDEPGQMAKLKWIKELIKFDYCLADSSFVVTLPKDKDPGDCSKEEIEKCLKNKINCIDYFLNHMTEGDIISICKEKEFYRNPIVRKVIERFATNNNFTFEESVSILKNKVRSYNSALTKNENEENEYLCRLKATAGIGEYGLKYEPIKGMTPDKALKIIRLKYK